MSYTAVDKSVSSGLPVELYQFIRGLEVWRFTNADRSIVYAGNTYVPIALTRSSIKLNEDVFKAGITVTVHRSETFAADLLIYSPDTATTLTIFRGHYGDDNYVTYWKGRIVGVSGGGNTLDIECESVFTSAKRPGLRAHYEYNCRHALYSARCGASASANSVHLSISAMPSSVTLTMVGANAFADGWFNGGMIQYAGNYRFILSHVGNSITLSRPLAGLTAGISVDLYAGCDHAKETCSAKFNNIVNFGGFPWVPTKNPYDGSVV